MASIKSEQIEALVNAGKILPVKGRRDHYMTEDMDVFQKMPGNRGINEAHVKQLIKQFTEQGNLIDDFPIIVNERLEVIDGQHRVEAFEILEWPVVFEVRQGLNIEQVRTINSAQKNWGWHDYAVSHADLGNDNYVRFLNLYQHFDVPFSVLMYYCTKDQAKGHTRSFRNGNFEMIDHRKTFDMLKRYQEAARACENGSREFAYAIKDVMQLPQYDHERMIRKLKLADGKFATARTKTDYLRALEDVYNFHEPEAERIRLF